MADPATDTGRDFPAGPPQPGEDVSSVSPDVLAARKTARSIVRDPGPVQIANDREFELLAPGTKFIGPDKSVRQKPYEVKQDRDYDRVPEGAQFIDPQGELRMKPKYEGVDITTQTLYDMSVNEAERKKSLERAYPGKVKTDPATGELYVDDDGTLRKPSHGNIAKRFAAGAAAGAAPVALGTLGAIGGGAVGSVEPGGGTVAGVAAGGAGGSVLGQMFNDMVMQLAGVYDRSLPEEAANVAMAGASGMAGAGVGRGLAAVAPAVKGVAQMGGQALPKFAAHVLGAMPEETRMARQYAERGEKKGTGLMRLFGLSETTTMPPPSGWAKEAPHIHNIVEVFDPAFHTQKPLLQSAEKSYESGAGAILDQLGVTERPKLTDPEAAVSTEKAGTAVLAKVRAGMEVEDAKLRAALERARATAQTGVAEKSAEHQAALAGLRQAEESSRKAAQAAIDQGFNSIQADVDAAVKSSGVGANSGELWNAVGEKLRSVRTGIQARAKKMYEDADVAAGSHLPNIEGLPETAEAFLNEVPDQFKSKYPDVVKRMQDFAGTKDPETGEWIKEPIQPTFGQLHNVRSLLRSNVNYYDLTSNIRDGAFKFFAKRVDQVLHDAEAVPELQEAAGLLDKADAFYRENMRTFNDRSIQSVVSGLESGMPADPKMLFDTLVKEGRSDLANKVRGMVGPNLWAGVRAADIQDMLDASKTLIPGQIDGRTFAKEVLSRHRANMLEAVHGREASQKLIQQAQYIEALNGKLDIPVRAGDTVTTLIARARQAAEEAKTAAKLDPIGLLNKEMKGIERDHGREVARVKAERRNDPMAFLYNPTTGATEAADKILGDEDLIFAAAAKFGENSPEFNMLRQVWVQRILQGTLEPGARLAKVSPEVQQIMFPGVTLKQMQTLAKEMDFLMGSRGVKDTAKSMAAVSKVEHPWSNILARGGVVGDILAAPTKLIPGADAAGRYILGGYYGLIRKLATSPSVLRWVEKGLEGGPDQREAVRIMIRRAMKIGGPIGVGAGEAAYQSFGREQPAPPRRAVQ
jgi:hypothetical protein